MKTVQELEDQIEELQEELKYWRTLGDCPTDQYFRLRNKGFWPREIKVLQALAKRRTVSRDLLLTCLGKDFSESYCTVIIYWLRGKLKTYGIEIKTVRGFGYTLSKKSHAKLQSLLSPNTPSTSPTASPLPTPADHAKLPKL